jgi:hypothetical protein
MTIGPIKAALGATLVGTALALAGTLPAAAQGNLQSVPRAGVSFANTVTVRATIESIDTATRTVAFTTADGDLMNLAVADSVGNLDRFADGSTVDITYNEVVTVLNLRQKGPGSQLARKQAGRPDAAEIEAGRFTMTVVGVDLAANKVSLINSGGGPVRTYAATSIANQDMLKKIKVGDVVIGLRTPLMATAITPAK